MRLPRTRSVRPLTRDLRRLLRRRRLPTTSLTREPRRPLKRGRPLRRLLLRELRRLPPHAKRVWGKSKEAAEEGSEMARAWETAKEMSTEGAEEAEDG